MTAALCDGYMMFTAAQAAQKKTLGVEWPGWEFTAAQAAQKSTTIPAASGCSFTAAQAAQKKVLQRVK